MTTGSIAVAIAPGSSGHFEIRYGVAVILGEYSLQVIAADDAQFTTSDAFFGVGTGSRAQSGGGIQDCAATGLVVAEDPVLIDVAQTRTHLSWQVGGGHPQCLTGSGGSCTPICPTPFNLSCWLLNGMCTRDADPPMTLHSFSAETYGHYVNWDFGDDNVATYVDNWSQVHLDGWVLSFNWAHEDHGEVADWINGRIIGDWDCFN